LNFAKRKAEKATISKPLGIKKPSRKSNLNDKRIQAITAGVKPKLITSAKESSCLPIGEYAFNKRAAKPSKKSKNADASTKINASSKSAVNAHFTAKQPQSKLQIVKKLGMCFFIFIYLFYVIICLVLPSTSLRQRCGG
jgi:hypothetical protein